MKAVVQRVTKASVTVENKTVSEIDNGLLVLLGVQEGDTEKEAVFLADKITNLRIFEDPEGKMNLSLKQVKGSLLVVSQFTLLGDCRKGRRPSFQKAARPAEADALYRFFAQKAAGHGIDVKTGVFQAMMDVDLTNSGPVTLILDTRQE